jgi:DNA-directed RNA polymerase specialized sigma24 family protein
MSSAARSAGWAAACAQGLRLAGDDHARRVARDRLARALRSEALRVLGIHGVAPLARDDLAQVVTLTVLDRIVLGGVEPGYEDAYVAVAAKNRARDWHREQSGVYEKTERCDDESIVAPGLDPHAALEHAEDAERLRALSRRVAAVLESAPARYRDALVAVYLEGVPIDELVDHELFREWPWPCDVEVAESDAIAARRRARARVDKLLQRARDWVKARLLAALAREEAPQ